MLFLFHMQLCIDVIRMTQKASLTLSTVFVPFGYITSMGLSGLYVGKLIQFLFWNMWSRVKNEGSEVPSMLFYK